MTIFLPSRPVVVIGGGTMGRGIAESFLVVGCSVALVEVDADRADAAYAVIAARFEARGQTASLARLAVEVGLPTQVDPGLVVEAVFEGYEAKGPVLRDASATYPRALIATNTSSLSVTKLAGEVIEPHRFVGMHFFNPVPRSALVELVRAERSSEEAVEAARSYVEWLQKTAIVVGDTPDLATSRLGIAIGLEAMRMVEEGVASCADIDQGMVLGYRFPIGPLELSDLVGLDVRLAIADHLAAELGTRFTPPQILRDKVAASQTGIKAGRGFYRWDGRNRLD